MRIVASVLGIVGALCGIFFAQLVVSVGMLLAIVGSQSGELELSGEFYLGLLALVIYAFGVAGGVVVLLRPLIGTFLMLASAIGGVVATIAINGTPSPQGGAFEQTFPYVGPALLLVAFGLAGFTLRPATVTATAPSAPVPAVVPAEAPAVSFVPGRAELASAVPMPILAAPSATAATRAEIQPGTPFDSFEQHGEFIHVRGDGFDGFLPAWSVRRV